MKKRTSKKKKCMKLKKIIINRKCGKKEKGICEKKKTTQLKKMKRMAR